MVDLETDLNDIKLNIIYFMIIFGIYSNNKQFYSSDLNEKIIKLYESPHVLVVVPLTTEASCRYGATTKWCTAAREENAFEHYNKFNVLIYVIPKNPVTPDTKLAIQIPFKQTAPAGYHFTAYNEKDEIIPSAFDMDEILMMYVRDENNNPLPMEVNDIISEIWHYFFQKSEN